MFRTVLHVSHEEFLDTPMEEIEWMLRIHNEVVKAENEAQKRQGGG